jgi:hypothetical protein
MIKDMKNISMSDQVDLNNQSVRHTLMNMSNKSFIMNRAIVYLMSDGCYFEDSSEYWEL